MHWEKIPHKMTPRDNQKVAIDNAVEGLTSVGFHGLFLEMSLGKTKVSLNIAEIMKHYGALSRVLIVCPKAIQSVWMEQIPEHTFFTNSPVIWENTPTRKKKQEIASLMLHDTPILIVRLELFQKKNEVLKNFLEDYFSMPTLVILDESSKIKNVTTQRTPRLIEYTRGATYRIPLTGTPWTESPLDIFSQMEFMKEGFWYTFHSKWTPAVLKKAWYIFRSRYAVMREITTSEGRRFKTVVGTTRVEEIAKKIQPYITQQKKEDWLDLPPKIFQVLHVEMSKEQAHVYTTMKNKLLLEYGDTLLIASNAVTLLTRLRQIAGGFYPETGEPISKTIPAIEMLLEDVSEYTGKVVIAASYIAEIEGIYKALSKEYTPELVTTYYGGTKDREGELERFKTTARFMVLNPQSGAYGLNLQFASLMYMYSRPFSYEQNAQLEDRIHRPGMTGTAVYKDIVVTGTVQERVIKAVAEKKDVVSKFDRLTLKDFLDTDG